MASPPSPPHSVLSLHLSIQHHLSTVEHPPVHWQFTGLCTVTSHSHWQLTVSVCTFHRIALTAVISRWSNRHNGPPAPWRYLILYVCMQVFLDSTYYFYYIFYFSYYIFTILVMAGTAASKHFIVQYICMCAYDRYNLIWFSFSVIIILVLLPPTSVPCLFLSLTVCGYASVQHTLSDANLEDQHTQ